MTQVLWGGEQTSKGGVITSTLYGGSNDAGPSSPADCIVKFKLDKNKNGHAGSLLPFSTDLMEYSDLEKAEVSFEFDKFGMTFISQEPLSICPMATDFNGDYSTVDVGSKEYKTYFNDLLQLNYHNAVQVFRAVKGNAAIELLDPYMSESIEQNYYQPGIFNDYGYFLQQAGMNQEATKYLSIVKDKSPKRIVVYLNVAGSYWNVKNEVEAIKNYKQYVSMMNSAGKNKQIPERVIERIQ